MCLCLQFVSDLFICARAFKEAVKQRLDIEGGAAHCDDRFIFIFDLADGSIGELQEACDAEWGAWFDNIDEVIWDLEAGLGRRFGGANIHSAVDLHGVDGDDFGIEIFCQLEGEPAFAGCSDAENENPCVIHKSL